VLTFKVLVISIKTLPFVLQTVAEQLAFFF